MLKIAKNPDKARRGKTRQDKTRRGGPQKRRCPLVLKNDIDRKFIRVHCWVSIDVQVSRFDMQWEVSYSEPASLHQCSWWRHQIQTFSALLAICAGIHRSPVNSPHKGQWSGALMFSLICAWINRWVNNGATGDLRHYRASYGVIVMYLQAAGPHIFAHVLDVTYILMNKKDDNFVVCRSKVQVFLSLIKCVIASFLQRCALFYLCAWYTCFSLMNLIMYVSDGYKEWK